jgi:hypothetical protein
MKVYEGVDVQMQVFLTSALVGGEWTASRPHRFNPGERVSDTHCIGSWVGPYMEKIFYPSATRNPTHRSSP